MSEITDYATEQAAEKTKKADDDAKPARQMKAAIQSWCDEIKFARKHDEDARRQWADDRRWAAGDVEWEVRANLIGAILEVLAAFLYAKNPDVKVKPSDSVNRQRITAFRSFAETITICVSRLWKNAGMKRVAKRWVRQSMTVGIGWLKATMRTRQEPNPIAETQINDLQQQMKNVEILEAELAEGKECEYDEKELDAKRARLEANLKALEAQLEIMVAEGLILDVYAPEDVIVSPGCGSIENYLNADWIAIDSYKTIEQAKALVDWNEKECEELFRTANLYKKRVRKGQNEDDSEEMDQPEHHYYQHDTSSTGDERDREAKNGFVRITEIWCKKDGVVYTIIDGVKEKWARAPYPPITGRRFYPVFDLCCHPIEGQRYPQSDVYQLKELQEEYNRARSNFSEHRRRSIPGTIFNKEAIDENDVAAIAEGTIQEMVGVKLTSPSIDIRSVFTPKAYAAVDMNLYNTQPITQEMEKISGAQDALQSSVAVEKTATEAKIQEAGFGARSGERRDVLEQSLTDLAEYTAQLVLQLFTEADAEMYAGPDAVWVEMDTEQAMWMFDVEIKAGSTGKPKVNDDREVWGTLLPLIEKLIDRIGQARMMGQEWAAKPWIALLDETMRRLDDPSELEKFLPVPPQPDPSAGEPSEQEKAEIDETRAKAENERTDSVKMLAEMGAPLPAEVATMYILFGGDGLKQAMMQNGRAPVGGAPVALPQQNALEEAPNPVEG